jgi:hypothetical protein
MPKSLICFFAVLGIIAFFLLKSSRKMQIIISNAENKIKFKKICKVKIICA